MSGTKHKGGEDRPDKCHAPTYNYPNNGQRRLTEGKHIRRYPRRPYAKEHAPKPSKSRADAKEAQFIKPRS